MFILGRLLPSHLSYLLSEMVLKNLAAYEPPKQTRSVILYWRLPEEWAEVLHAWVRAHYPYSLKHTLIFGISPATGHCYRPTEHHSDLLRDYRPANRVSPYGNPASTPSTSGHHPE